MLEVWQYTLISVLVISLFSFVGIFTLAISSKKLEKFLIYMISFAAGALFGDAFIHLLPEIVEQAGFGIEVSLYVLFGIIFSFIVEKIIYWRHCHMPITDKHVHSIAWMNLIGDGIHNFIDGIIIAASFMINTEVGIATTVAVLLHEIPQEIADFGVLVHGGFSKNKALFVNFLTAVTAVGGAILTLIIKSDKLTIFLIPFAAGSFIYIAGADLLPELHNEPNLLKSVLQVITFILGVLVMLGLALIG